MIEPGGKEGERSPVRRPGEADHRVVVAFLGDLGAGGGKINELARVCALVSRVVQVNPTAGSAEATRGVDDHCVDITREGTGGRLAISLGAAESMCQHDCRPMRGGICGQNRRVELYRLTVRLRRT